MLIFNLKKEWFDKIKAGEKIHEYREVKPHWITRIKNHFDYLSCDIEELRCGSVYYPIMKNIILRYGYTGEKLKAKVTSIKIIDGWNTDLKTNKDVFDIEFELLNEVKDET